MAKTATMDDITTLRAFDTAEFDAQVAVNVHGWRVFPYIMPGGNNFRYVPPGVRDHVTEIKPAPSFSTDPAQDLETLKIVRGWPVKNQIAWATELRCMVEKRGERTGITWPLFIEVGDYSAAALMVVMGSRSRS